MPWVVKLHIISAFVIIAIIPFTRYMHFLVAPVAYIWRKYQVVIWNYNRRSIRKSTQHTFGKKSNHHWQTLPHIQFRMAVHLCAAIRLLEEKCLLDIQ